MSHSREPRERENANNRMKPTRIILRNFHFSSIAAALLDGLFCSRSFFIFFKRDKGGGGGGGSKLNYSQFSWQDVLLFLLAAVLPTDNIEKSSGKLMGIGRKIGLKICQIIDQKTVGNSIKNLSKNQGIKVIYPIR